MFFLQQYRHVANDEALLARDRCEDVERYRYLEWTQRPRSTGGLADKQEVDYCSLYYDGDFHGIL